jgi:hypothetical protein
MPQPAISSQRPSERAAHEGDVDLGRRLGEREEGRTEAHLQVVGLEEAAQEIGDDALEVGKADRLADPQAFDLVEHRRMGGIGIDAIDAARRDDAQLGHGFGVAVALDVRLHVARIWTGLVWVRSSTLSAGLPSGPAGRKVSCIERAG